MLRSQSDRIRKNFLDRLACIIAGKSHLKILPAPDKCQKEFAALIQTEGGNTFLVWLHRVRHYIYFVSQWPSWHGQQVLPWNCDKDSLEIQASLERTDADLRKTLTQFATWIDEEMPKAKARIVKLDEADQVERANKEAFQKAMKPFDIDEAGTLFYEETQEGVTGSISGSSPANVKLSFTCNMKTAVRLMKTFTTEA